MSKSDLRELMNIPDNYKVLFLQGGASQQFAMIPMNLMKNKKADYIVKEMTFDPKCVICYDLLKNEYFEYVSNDPFSPKKLLEKKEIKK